MFSWLFRYVIIGPLLRHIVRAEVIGREKLPRRGAYILAIGSHKTELESAVIASWLRRRRLHFYAKAEYWQKGRLWAWFMDVIGQIPVERGDSKKANQAIDAGAELLKRGEVLAVYPEGTRSPDDRLHGGYTGFARTLVRAGGDIPVVPVGLVGMELVSPSGGGLMPKRANVKIVIGEPIYLTRVEKALIKTGRPGEAQVAGAVTRRTMQAISALCGKRYVSAKLPIRH